MHPRTRSWCQCMPAWAVQDALLDGSVLYGALVSEQAAPLYRDELVSRGCSCRSLYDVMAEAEGFVSGGGVDASGSADGAGGSTAVEWPLCPQLVSGALLTTYNAMAVRVRVRACHGTPSHFRRGCVHGYDRARTLTCTCTCMHTDDPMTWGSGIQTSKQAGMSELKYILKNVA